MTLPTINEVQDMKEYLRIDGDDDDNLIESFILVAKEDLTDSGIKNQTTQRYQLAVKLMVANYYEQRRPQAIGTVVSNLEYSLERIILQLKAAELGDSNESR